MGGAWGDPEALSVGASRDRLRDPVGLGCLTSPSSHNETDPYSHPQLNRQQRPLAKKSKMGEGRGGGDSRGPRPEKAPVRECRFYSQSSMEEGRPPDRHCVTSF